MGKKRIVKKGGEGSATGAASSSRGSKRKMDKGVLYVEALSTPDGPAPTYAAMFRRNVDELTRAMMQNRAKAKVRTIIDDSGRQPGHDWDWKQNELKTDICPSLRNN